MIYKALMLDVDGTVVPYDYDALPSDAVVDAVTKAQSYVTVCIVTGRSFGFTKPVLDKLGLHSGYAVFNNGGQVMDLSTETLVYDQPIVKEHADEIVEILERAEVNFYLKQEIKGLGYKLEYFKSGDTVHKPYMFFTAEAYPETKIDTILKELSHINDITAYKGHHKEPGKFGLTIIHAQATKLHGVHVIAEKLGITPEEIIGVGDGYNDFPLLMASGLKVAMGNAVEDLKEIADYIAPTVDDDGAADVIKKYILSNHSHE